MLGKSSFMAKVLARAWISLCSSVRPEAMSKLVTKAGLLAPCRAAVEAEAGVALEVTVKPKGEDGAAQVRAILEALPGDDAGPLGVPAKDKHDGAFFELWGRLVEEQGLATVDAGPGIAQLLAPKDAEEQVQQPYQS